jgi:hypothetical protein
VLKIISIAGNDGLAVEVKARDLKFTWDIVGIYRAPNEDLQVIERLTARTEFYRA